MNFWRCFTHWIGGMGVLVFLLAIIPLSGGSNINLMRAESPGPSVGKLVPKMRHTAQAFIHNILWSYDYGDYFPAFRKNASVRCHLYLSWHSRNRRLWYQKRQLLRLQCLSAVGCYHIYDTFRSQFQRLLPAFLRSHRDALKVEEVRYYFGIIIASVVVISVNIAHMCTGVFDAVTKAAFQVGSIITTTGFSTPISTDGLSFQRHCLCF